MNMLERDFQAKLIKKVERMFPGSIVMKLDTSYKQGVPDLLILYKDKWATLEVKKNELAHHQPNQDYYVGMMDDMSFSKFIYPANEEEVLLDLFRYFEEE